MLYYPHMPIGKVRIYRLLCLFMCTVTDFSAEDKACDVKLFSAVHRRLRQGISNFCELCSSRRPKSDESACARATPTRLYTLPQRRADVNVTLEMRRS